MAENNQSVYEAQNENFKRHDAKIDRLSEEMIHLRAAVNGSPGQKGLLDRVAELETGALAKANRRSLLTLWFIGLAAVGAVIVPFLIFYLGK